MTKSTTRHATPYAAGFHLPAEWEPHEATWLAWPHEKTDWPGKFAPIPWIYAQIIRHLARVEKVRILVNDAESERSVLRMLRQAHVDLNGVETFHHPTNRSWTRDYCPLFVRSNSGEVAITEWKFNGWAKYANSTCDAKTPSKIAKKLRLRKFTPGRVLEGGSIDTNGAGLLLTTEECLLDEKVQTRNPGLTRRDYEHLFRDYFGIRETIWLHKGIVGDDTHGHVDDLARFTGPHTIVTVIESEKSDPNYDLLRENFGLLRARARQSDQLRIVTLPMPEPIVFAGQRLPASYANFYIANQLVLVPTFTDKNDRVVLNTLQKLFPNRQIIGIPCRDLVLGLGTLHCMTMQQPV